MTRCVALTLIVAGVASHAAATDSTDWAAVTRLPEGTAITVTIDGRQAEAVRFVKADDRSLLIDRPGVMPFESVPRQAVVQITRQQTDRGLKLIAAVGGVIGGFFAGAHVGALLQPACACDDPGLTGAVIGAPIGAVTGGIFLPRAVRPRKVIVFQRADAPGDSAAHATVHQPPVSLPSRASG